LGTEESLTTRITRENTDEEYQHGVDKTLDETEDNIISERQQRRQGEILTIYKNK
jgi:hypothetical protein